MKQALLYILLTALVVSGCNTIKETSKHQMESGVYHVKNYSSKPFYVVVKEDSITMHPARKTKGRWLADPSLTSIIHLKTANPNGRQQTKFVNSSFDLDVMSILFKYRPYTAGFPNQLNTNFNAAEFIGYRSDLYILSFDKDPLGTYHRSINHFAFSFGGFVGLGATPMNPSVTNNFIQSEYDGVVITKGIAGLIGVGEFTFGMGLGLDHLLDKNRKAWIYQRKPWCGFTVGFNIN